MAAIHGGGVALLHAVQTAAAHGHGGGVTYTLPVQTVILMTLLMFLPAIVLMMTGFTRIIIVLSLLRQGLGLSTMPPNIVLIGLALFLTFFVMQPTWTEINQHSLIPLEQGKISVTRAIRNGEGPLRVFMLKNTTKDAVSTFLRMDGIKKKLVSKKVIPMRVLVPAFAVSQLESGFEMGFLVYLPLLVIDLLVAAILMAMGMMMVSPQTISIPIKLMLFVLAGGWLLVTGTLVRSFFS
ncbi:flagellar type III secretion system pore protein FliP [Acidithiobacillus thiooxidans]|uniref:Flagellar biosynthetic protein FliP n=1 Tax=Acidithiobacillus thiooxidans TaxID=930 RepID=A0A1C2IT64_ACITH|nr:flagellar type III secretion system pore protein FliP [Acidithiobacillus thiooxidans]OCX72180.1 flagellar biosynthetic protein FliP [Acidithiobacillus thiooxidans]OCX79231.1 flagellar biosynthetic protein FliP [Acidithiobacillus thiooxidans]